MTLLETDGLTKRFGNLVAVDNVDLRIERGEIHSVIGPNGAGKSTLFNLITGLLAPTSGSIRFKGEDITGLKPYEIVAKGISRSFQIADLFEGLTVEENVRVAAQSLDANRDALWRRADTLETPARATAEILDVIELSDVVETRADALSHGDRRKLEIGLTIATQPELFLLDEPTAGMGKEESIQTVRMIRRVADERDITPVLIEHDLEIVMGISDYITVLNEGAIIATGSSSEIQANEEVQHAYLGTEVQ